MQGVVAADPGPGATLRQWREHCAMTPAALGDAIGVGADQVDRRERGELQFGSLDIEAVPAILWGIAAKDQVSGTLTQLIDAQQQAFEGDVGGEGA